jgi:class 3 adenylate cyclase/DNA-binding CsgD family transcriptional regulator/predicted negative regulator of RcsB-dependent stress response
VTQRDLPTGTVTFLFSDIEGSTALLKQLGRERYGELLTAHNALLRRVFEETGGLEIDRQGDAFFFVFPSAGSAVLAAAAAQRALQAHGWPEDGVVRVRMGVHTGEASLSDDGYVGFAVHQASRIGDLGHGGQILLSRTTAALVEHELTNGTRIRDLGETRLPGLDRPEQIFQLVADGLPERFPPLGARRQAPLPQSGGRTLLEREAELAAIQAYVDSAASGAGRLIAIEGRAGMGKTRLLAETRAIAAQADVTVLTARGGELEQEFAYGIVRQLFEPTLAAASPEERDELLGGAAALAAPLFEDAQLAALDEDRTDVSFAMLHGLYWLAANLALRKPLVVAIDDVHWADGPSLRWLVHLQRRLEGLPLLVVAATRPPGHSRNEQMLTELLADPGAAVVRPMSLGTDSVDHLAREIFGRDADEAFVVAICEASGGNPLFVLALIDTIQSEELEPSAANAARVHEIGPEPVTRAVSLRLSRLPSEATVLARAVAILGDRAELHHAATLAGLERDLATHAATTLGRADLLGLDLPLEFTHPVVRTAVYDDMSAAERIAGHRRAAQILSDTGAEPEQIAVHLEHSVPNGDPFVVETLQKAAQVALQRGSSDVAVALLRRALDEPPADRGEVLRALGLAERLLWNDDAIVHLGEAFDAIEEPKRRARIAIELGRALLRANRHQEAIDAYRKGREVLADADESLRLSLSTELVNAAWWHPEHVPVAIAEVEQIREETLPDGVAGDLVRATLGYWETRRGVDRERAANLARRALAPQRIDLLGARALHLATYTLAMAGYPDEALAVYDRVLRASYAQGDNVGASNVALFRAYTQVRRGDLAAAESDIGRFKELMTWPTAYLYSGAFQAELAREQGDLAAADAFIAESGLPDELPANGHLTFFQLARARVRYEQRRFDDAIRELTSLGKNLEELQIGGSAYHDWRVDLALALHAADRRKEALPYALEAVDRAREWGAPPALGAALRVLGLVEGGTSGEKLLHEAVAVLEESQARLEYAKSLVDLGAALRRGNQRSEAREFLRQGAELAHRLGAATLEERAQTELAATGARPRRLMLTGLDSLTPSERRVAEMAADNMTNKDIAQALFVTPKTVEVHLSSVYRKLQISSRGQLPGVLAPA